MLLSEAHFGGAIPEDRKMGSPPPVIARDPNSALKTEFKGCFSANLKI